MNLLLSNLLGPWTARMLMWSGVAMGMAGAPPTCCAQAQDQVEPISCLVQVLDRVALPAERQGVLETVPCRIGSPVESGQVVATLKRKKAELNLQRLAAELRRLQQAQDNVARVERYDAVIGEKQFELDQLDLFVQTMRQSRNFQGNFDVPALERRRLDSALEQASADRTATVSELEQAASEVAAKKSEMEIAELELEASQIVSPFSGTVHNVMRRESEWVREGDPIMEIVRMDQLEVAFTLSLADYPPNQGMGADFQVQILGPQGAVLHETIARVERIQYLTDSSELYLAFARIDNVPTQTDTGKRSWLLLPGLVGEARRLPQDAAVVVEGDFR